MINKIIDDNNICEKDKKAFKNLIIIVSLITFIFILTFIFGIFTKENTNIPNLKSTIFFIRSFNSILSVLSLGTCLISYRRLKSDDVFVIFLMYVGLSVGIMFGQIDFLSFYYEEYSLKNYLTLSTSILRITLLLIALSPNNIFKKYMVNNKKKSILFVIFYTIIMGTIEKKLEFIGMGYSSEFFVVYNAILAMVYICSSIILFTIGKEKKEYLFMVLGSSIFMLAVKAIYAIHVAKSILFDVKLISVSITYLMFLIIIGGTFIELYTYINKTKILNQDLAVFYNFTENNKHSFMLICNDKGDVLYANTKVKEHYLNEESDSYREKLSLILEEKCMNIDNKDEIAKSLNEKGIWRGIIRNKKDKVYIDCSIQLISTIEDKKEIAITYMDISEEIKKELEFEKLKIYTTERTEFMSNISHELRTPVNIFYSTIQLLDKFSLYEDFDFKSMYGRYKNTLHVNCKRMLRLINNVVDISKIETGILKGKFDYFNIVAIVEDVTLSVVNYAELKSINIEFDTNGEENISKCDSNLIERALLNLLSNAIKFSPENSTIYVNILVNDDWTEIDIRDEGIGISKEDKQAIFERFVQADKSLTRENEGSGIGLSIVKSIIDLHDGYISVSSELGVGSTFKIILPNKCENCDEYKIYDIDDYNIELELSDIYEVLINIENN
ncbi:MAG: HAMP domain-containing sensor histidine kinase [Terrisporobacter sp.]|uniref:sensor histidine kinase n=1 Tax=Terrisporobacter sp. TaxID=1965305 RepID=UPI002FC9745F